MAFASMPSTYFVLLLGLAGLIVLRWKRAADKYYGLPVVGRGDEPDFRSTLEEGTRKYPDSPYVIPDKPPMVILPHRMVDKVKSLPEAQASADKNVYRRGLGQYTDLGNPLPALFDGIRVDLTRHIRDLLSSIQGSIAPAFDEAMAGSDGKQAAVCVFPLMKRVVAQTSAAAFVRPGLARDPAWIAATMQYSTDLKTTFAAFHRIAPLLRPVAAPFLFRRLGISERRRAVEQMLSEHAEACAGKTERLVDWVWARLAPEQRTSQMVARTQLRAALASSDTVAHTLTNAVYDLAAQPACARELREELEGALAGTAAWDMARLKQLIKMDSFLRESARLHPLFMTAVGRVLTAPLPLDDGRVLPVGAVVSFSQNFAHYDASIQPGPAGPHAFDPWRFSRLRSAASEPDDNADARLHFTTTSSSNLTFGHGVHACPGRFFADAEIKLILAHLLLTYEIALPEGTARPQDAYAKLQWR